jgi:sulfotransferase family protein
MMLTASALRAIVRTTNAAGSTLKRAGLPLVSFDERGLLDAARRVTGLDDLGDDGFREPLRMVLQGLETEARLTLVGRIAARQDVVGLLASRLRLVDDGKRHPEIGAQEVPHPLFIVGLPRTGSTLLHHLLAQDPGSRVAQAWEVMFPSPPPETGSYRTDPRIARAARQLAWFDALAPEFKAIHPLGAQLALECIAIMSPTFLSPRFHTTYHVPTYQEWLERQDLRPAYRFHRRFLQQLQWRAPAQRWVLKAPAHLFAFDALLEAYPDARIVQTHRDPLTVLASVASLTAVLQGAFTDELDPLEIGREVSRRWTNGLDRAMRLRRSGRLPAERFVDVHYHEMVRDPIAVVRRIYAHFEIPLTEAAEASMRRFLAENPKDKHGAHRYSLGSFGLEADDLVRRFKAYREFYGVPREEASPQ